MKGSRLALCSSMSLAAAFTSAAAPRSIGDLRFLEGATESVSIMKVMMQKPFVSRCIGQGKIHDDGSLELVQHVTEEGRRTFDRRWYIYQVAPGRFAGTMSEAKGPISIQKIGSRYVLRFVMKGNLSVEQWFTPQANMTSAQTRLTVRRFGIAVAHSDGSIRRTDSVQLGGDGPQHSQSL